MKSHTVGSLLFTLKKQVRRQAAINYHIINPLFFLLVSISTTSIELVERQGQRKRKFPGFTNSFPFLNLYSHFKSNYSFKNSTLSSVSFISVDSSTC